jgi:hypothetical protein
MQLNQILRNVTTFRYMRTTANRNKVDDQMVRRRKNAETILISIETTTEIEISYKASH